MTQLLHIDSSPRSAREGRTGSHTRRMSARFVSRWLAARPKDAVLRRDVGVAPPAMVTADFVEAAFTRPTVRSAAMAELLCESDQLVDELLACDLVVVGVPMYNFGPPAQLKAWIDNIVRVGRTFGFDRSRAGVPYFPLLSDLHKRVVLLSARGDFGYGPGERLAHMNHVEPSLRSALGYMGLTEVHAIAIEYDEFADARLRTSIEQAEQAIDRLVDQLLEQA
jgi:FMN-dependent NADH-azoreductase